MNMKEWRAANKEHIKEYMREWREKNKKHVYEYAESWRRAHPKVAVKRTQRWVKNNPEKYKSIRGKWRADHPDKARAHGTLANALRRGKIVKPDTCPCGNPNPHGHHTDYSKPLMVMWLCRDCHNKLHREMRLAAKKKG